jgi:hypothetical protein
MEWLQQPFGRLVYLFENSTDIEVLQVVLQVGFQGMLGRNLLPLLLKSSFIQVHPKRPFVTLPRIVRRTHCT